jgi:hypothetical protein
MPVVGVVGAVGGGGHTNIYEMCEYFIYRENIILYILDIMRICATYPPAVFYGDCVAYIYIDTIYCMIHI